MPCDSTRSVCKMAKWFGNRPPQLALSHNKPECSEYSILLRVFSRFPFWLFVRDHRDHSRLFIFETGNIYFFHKCFHTRLLNKMFFFPVYFCLTIFSYYFLFRVNHYVGLKSNWFNDRWRYNKEDYINVIKEIIRGRKLECD